MDIEGTRQHNFSECLQILDPLIGSQQWFNQPVVDEYPHLRETYLKIVEQPMDLTTIRNKLLCQEYADVRAFESDVKLVWKNAHSFNEEGSDVCKSADKCASVFSRKMRRINAKKRRMEENTQRFPENKKKARRAIPSQASSVI